MDQLHRELEALHEEHASATSDHATVVVEDAGVQDAKAELLDAQARLSARERRVQLLAHRFSQAATLPCAGSSAVIDATESLEAQLRVTEQRASDLEDIITDTANRLDQCQKERCELLNWRRDAESVDQEQARRMSEAAEARGKTIESLQAELARAKRTSASGSSSAAARTLSTSEDSWYRWDSNSGDSWSGSNAWRSSGAGWKGW